MKPHMAEFMTLRGCSTDLLATDRKLVVRFLYHRPNLYFSGMQCGFSSEDRKRAVRFRYCSCGPQAKNLQCALKTIN